MPFLQARLSLLALIAASISAMGAVDAASPGIIARADAATDAHTSPAPRQASVCPTGQFLNPGPPATCQSCPPLNNCVAVTCTGVYDATCMQCARGFSGPQCSECDAGYYTAASPTGAPMCAQCPRGAGACNDGIWVCSGPTDSRCGCEKGRYPNPINGGYHCMPCRQIAHCSLATCTNGEMSVCETCYEGYGGMQCNTCTAGYFAMASEVIAGRTECRQCPTMPECQATACSSPQDAYCVLCLKGFKEPSCTECDTGFYPTVCLSVLSLLYCSPPSVCPTVPKRQATA